MTAEENKSYFEIGRVNVTDRDDRGTRNWEARYSILPSNDPKRSFAITTDPATNQGVISVVKVPHAALMFPKQDREKENQGQNSSSFFFCIVSSTSVHITP